VPLSAAEIEERLGPQFAQFEAATVAVPLMLLEPLTVAQNLTRQHRARWDRERADTR
jgi:hypothetical protein